MAPQYIVFGKLLDTPSNYTKYKPPENLPRKHLSSIQNMKFRLRLIELAKSRIQQKQISRNDKFNADKATHKHYDAMDLVLI